MKNLIMGGMCGFNHGLQFLNGFHDHYAFGSANHFVELIRDVPITGVKIPFTMIINSPARLVFIREMLRLSII